MATWIDLSTYASKYGISQSTLRRRIRAKSIAFKLEKGKYMLEDAAETLRKAPLFARGKNPNSEKLKIKQQIKENPAESLKLQKELEKSQNENRRLQKELAELETFVNALESELEELQKKSLNRPSPVA